MKICNASILFHKVVINLCKVLDNSDIFTKSLGTIQNDKNLKFMKKPTNLKNCELHDSR